MARAARRAEAGPLDPDTLAALRALAEQGAGRDFVATSSGELAARLGVSQQTASRKILDLLARGLVQRRMGQRRQLLKLTPEGIEALRGEFEKLRALFEPDPSAAARPATLRLQGRVATGLGEGAWYIARRGYRDAMRALLGFEPFPGTLNVALEGPEAAKLATLRARDGLLVPEFEDEGRTFGAVKCFRGSIAGVDAAAVLPLRGHHRDVLEVVAPVHLRDKLGLQDGTEVAIEVALG